MMRNAFDWRSRVAELRAADGSDEATARRYGAATKRLQADLPKLAKRLSARQISEAYGVSQVYVQRLLRIMRGQDKPPAKFARKAR